MSAITQVVGEFVTQATTVASDPEVVQVALLAGGYKAYSKYKG